MESNWVNDGAFLGVMDMYSALFVDIEWELYIQRRHIITIAR